MSIGLVILNIVIIVFISIALYIKYLGSDDKAAQGFLFLVSGCLQIIVVIHYYNDPSKPDVTFAAFLVLVMLFVGVFRTHEFYENRSQAKTKTNRSKIIVVTKWRDTNNL
jgi:hypothetical protein